MNCIFGKVQIKDVKMCEAAVMFWHPVQNKSIFSSAQCASDLCIWSGVIADSYAKTIITTDALRSTLLLHFFESNSQAACLSHDKLWLLGARHWRSWHHWILEISGVNQRQQTCFEIFMIYLIIGAPVKTIDCTVHKEGCQDESCLTSNDSMALSNHETIQQIAGPQTQLCKNQ